jgi:hypothetical protein
VHDFAVDHVTDATGYAATTAATATTTSGWDFPWGP